LGKSHFTALIFRPGSRFVLVYNKGRYNTSSGLTLVELLIAIALISILCALLFAGWSRMSNKADETACVSNMRQVGLAIIQYTAENNGSYPGPAWVTVTNEIRERSPSILYNPLGNYIYPYLGVKLIPGQDVTVKALVCPATRKKNPSLSGHYQRLSGSQVDLSPFGTFAATDGGYLQPMSVSNVEQRWGKPLSKIVAIYDMDVAGEGPIHSGGRNYLFLDGHVSWSKGKSLPK
jgi:prepilin-type processing-associated H-X9-DG protein/prepilin-type N-terminal cleavage/methylation domain-containing protein